MATIGTPLGEVGAVGQVGGVGGVAVGFAFEGDGHVGFEPMAVPEESDEPFEEVDDVEGDVEQFAHLRGVDALVAYYFGGNPACVAGPYRAEEVDAEA